MYGCSDAVLLSLLHSPSPLRRWLLRDTPPPTAQTHPVTFNDSSVPGRRAGGQQFSSLPEHRDRCVTTDTGPVLRGAFLRFVCETRLGNKNERRWGFVKADRAAWCKGPLPHPATPKHIHNNTPRHLVAALCNITTPPRLRRQDISR